MITAVEKDTSGQSVIEFLIVLPLMVGLVVLMVRVNTAIQVSIVNQQYVRAYTLFFAYNSPIYPRLRNRVGALDAHGYNQILLGISNQKISEGDGYEQENITPDAAVISLTEKKGGVDDPHVEPELRSRVRVRTTVTLCTQTNVIKNSGGKYWPILELGDERSGFPAISPNRLKEGVSFDYCRAPEGIYTYE